MHRPAQINPHALVGIDPGRQGAVAILDLLAGAPPHWDVLDMPLEDGAVASGQFALELAQALRGRTALVAIEAGINIASRGGVMLRGVTTYLREQGQLVGALRTLQAIGSSCSLEIEEVPPFSWKSHFGLCNAGKRGSIDFLVRTAPRIAATWSRNGVRQPLEKLKDGHADAVLIAAYSLAERRA